jgi:uncharacterized protein involved in response to NO
MITRGEQMLALRKSRMAATHPFLRGGFRPFFLGGAAWGLIALTLWLLALAGALSLPTHFDPIAWHRHEMLFGFVGAVIAGFLLTAIPNWTGRLPIAGYPLAGLVALWLAARLAVLFSSITGAFIAAVLDSGFFLILAVLAGREVLLSNNNRNFPVVGIVLLFGTASALHHASVAGLMPNPDLGWQLGIALVVLLISLIGGRITPSFTRNWMAKQGLNKGLPTQPGRFDLFVIGATAFALLMWLTDPAGVITGGLLVIAAALQGARLARWGGFRAVSDPLVLILHVGYVWVPVGLLLLGLGSAGLAVPQSAAVHALTAGAMATMILAVMTRASLGHTGRELKASMPTVGIYVLVTVGALLRVAAPLGYADYTLSMQFSALAWGGALLLFLFIYGPILWRPRLGARSA